ncbi:hypothetical protein FBU30_006055 [Linnemannia zychae]|nr:hypothetical protein FBU30_006055 [Linnemannia zychae]
MSTESSNAILLQLRTAPDIPQNPDLEAVSTRLQVDANFRVEFGIVPSVWTNLTSFLEKTIKSGLDPEHVEKLMFIFRIVRNSVAGVTENQDQARHGTLANLPKAIQEVISQAAHTHYGNIGYIMMLRAGVQALSNLLTGNEASRNYIWKSLLVEPPSPACDENLLSTLAAIEDEAIRTSTVVLCYNCIFESQERSTLLCSTKPGKKLLKQLMTESHATSAKEERKSFELIYTFVNHLIEHNFVEQLYDALMDDNPDDKEEYKIRYHGEGFHGPVKKEPKIQELRIEEADEEAAAADKTYASAKQANVGISFPNQEQVTFLKMVDSKIFTHYEKQHEIFQQQQQQRAMLSDPFAVDETSPPVSLKTASYLTDLFCQMSTLTINVFKGLDKPGVGQHSVEDLANLSSALMLLLGCFAHLSIHEDGHVNVRPKIESSDNNSEDMADEEIEQRSEIVPVPEWFKAQHMAMVKGGLVESAIELLRQADVSLARVTKPVSSSPSGSPAVGADSESTLLSNTSTVQGRDSFFVGLKRDIVRLVGNLAYRSRHVQDRIRSCNGLIVMLSQCNIDDANPYLREYAILAMKNILTGNAENQALIEELQPIEAVDHPALQEARITARLDAETGRPVLTQHK